VENVACIMPFSANSVPPPSVLLPSKNVTVPVAMQQGETVAVNVTDWPKVAGLRLELSVVVVLSFTTCVNVPEEPP